MGTRLFVVVVGVLCCSDAWADKPPPLEQAIKQAAAAHKPLVIEFGAAWCGPCKMFEARVLPAENVKKALETIVFVRYDVDEDPGERAAETLNVSVYPTFVVLDSTGVELAREQGFLNVGPFIELIERARREAVDEQTIREMVKDKPNDPVNLMLTAHWYQTRKRHPEAIKLYERVSTSKLATTEQRTVATTALVRLRRMQQWKAQLLAEKVALVKASLADADRNDILLVTVGAGGFRTAAQTRALMKQLIDAEHSVEDLNKLVYIALAAGAHDEALDGAKALVAMRRSAQFLDTLAECYHMRGDRKMALETIGDAIDISRYADVLPALERNRKRFIEGDEEESITQMRLRAKDLWDRIDRVDVLADHIEQPDKKSARPNSAAATAANNAFYAAYTAQKALANAASTACKPDAGGNEEAYARIEVDPSLTVTSAVLMLEPTATKALRDCLTKNLIGATLAANPSRPKVTLSIRFVP